ncbi:MAG: sugar phosphate isomerase/epimerase family protein [Kiritimatiellia bacterium]|nr:sugar phosphate isomerase/epimerase [Lentisphaerota bacterium]
MGAGNWLVGIQLYSLRKIIADDVPGCLRQLAEMGYRAVEFAGYYGRSGAELRGMLDECGLSCVGSHTGLPLLEGDQFENTVEINRALGTDRLIVPSMPLDELERSLERLNAACVRARNCGMRVGYHNHAREFELLDGVTIFDRICEATPADLLLQLDLGWAAAAGQDIPLLLRRYADRMETVHIKEYNATNPAAAVGEGQVSWPEIFPLLAEKGIREVVVEQESFEVGPLESARVCIENINKWTR